MNQQINRLNRSVICYHSLQYPPLKEIQLKTVKALAGQYGFNYPYYEKTGIWATDKEIETAKKEDPFIGVLACKSILIKCKSCNTDFEKRKETQIFCSQICKNKFHNSKKV